MIHSTPVFHSPFRRNIFNVLCRGNKENQYDLFFEFYYSCVKLRIRNEDEKIDATVSTAYQNLLIQQLEYLRPNKFDFRTFVAGRKTTGEIIVREDPFPTFDLPIYELRNALEQGRKFENAEEYLARPAMRSITRMIK